MILKIVKINVGDTIIMNSKLISFRIWGNAKLNQKRIYLTRRVPQKLQFRFNRDPP